MNQSLLWCVAVLCLAIALGGCSAPLPQDDPHNDARLTPTPDVQTGDFDYAGTIGFSGVGDGCVQNISIVLYDTNKNPIDRTHVGTLCYNGTEATEAKYNTSAPKSKSISINASTQPTYITVESPDFWDGNAPVKPSGLVRYSDRDVYDEYPIEEHGQIRPRGVHRRTTEERTTAGSITLAPISRFLAGCGLVLLSVRRHQTRG